MAIGRLHTVVLDCPDHQGLAEFYVTLTGMVVLDADPDWVTLRGADGVRLGFQRAPGHQPPTWPDPAVPQQVHLDVEVDDVAVAEERVLALGARRLPGGRGTTSGFRVFADPAGHPFCLVWGQ